MSTGGGGSTVRHAPRPLRYAVIMAGGESRRVWPLYSSRAPKWLLPVGRGRTLLQETARRLIPLVSWRRIVVVTGAAHANAVRRQLPRVPHDQVLVEPAGRNTAACIALAAEWIATRAADALMIVVPADHVIKDRAGLQRTLRAASDLAARRDCLVTVGIKPTGPETGYGYIEVAGPVDARSRDIFWVRRFHEKPATSAARRYVASGRYLWNAGMFVWKASVFRAALERCLPHMRAALDGLWKSRRGVEQRLRGAYRRVPSVSVDVAVVQPISTMRDGAPQVAVIRAGFDWIDTGNWGAMAELWGRDRTGNAAVGKLVAIDATDSIVYCPRRLVALVGVKNLIVAESDGALLVCARERAQDVRHVAQELRQRGWSRYI